MLKWSQTKLPDPDLCSNIPLNLQGVAGRDGSISSSELWGFSSITFSDIMKFTIPLIRL